MDSSSSPTAMRIASEYGLGGGRSGPVRSMLGGVDAANAMDAEVKVKKEKCGYCWDFPEVVVIVGIFLKLWLRTLRKRIYGSLLFFSAPFSLPSTFLSENFDV